MSIGETKRKIYDNIRLDWYGTYLKIYLYFRTNWEKTPVHIKRDNSNYYKVLMSTPILDKILREHYVLFTKNIDITSYVNGTRETHNPSGRAVPTVVWDYYSNGCSVRMLNPQTFLPRLHTLNGKKIKPSLIQLLRLDAIFYTHTYMYKN